MHTEAGRDANLLGAWSLAVADAVREATERVTGLGGAVGAGTVLYAVSIGPLAHVTIPAFSRGRVGGGHP
jgi:hypothetical protein